MSYSVHQKRSLDRLLQYLKGGEFEKHTARLKRPLRMMIVGIPNVGKSTLINSFVRKAATKTGNQPGITRGKQWIRFMPGFELLDTPGVLWPEIDDKNVFPLAAVGAIPAGRFDRQSTALWLINRYRKREKTHLLFERYPKIQAGDKEAMFEQIGVSQGCLQSAGKLDAERTAALLLRDYQRGDLGRLTLEEPPRSPYH